VEKLLLLKNHNNNMKMYEVGQKRGEEMELEAPSKNEMYYPHLDLNSKQLPEIKSWKVGQKYMLVLEVKATRKAMNEKEGKEAKDDMCFEIHKVGVKEKEMSNDEKTDSMVEKMYPKKEDK
jgi:hypothetical protein